MSGRVIYAVKEPEAPGGGVRVIAHTDNYPGWAPAPHVWAVSRESIDVLARVHPHLPLSHIPNPVDSDLFRPGHRAVRRIAWMPRRRPLESTVLERILRNDARTQDVELLPLSGLTEEQVAEALGETSVFIALGISEGFGLPVAEPLSAGCLVVGYPAGGGAFSGWG
ncbi:MULTISPECIES: glycosyltransferase [unclassified Kribbella]|uniref:glycosyltransferase n=1 Tax=unclassified Kribbella TaxID=2644121 RepID=UPI0034012136